MGGGGGRDLEMKDLIKRVNGWNMFLLVEWFKARVFLLPVEKLVSRGSNQQGAPDVKY